LGDLNPLNWWRRFLALPNDSRTKTFVVAFLVASVSAAAVSVTAVSLKPRQDANAALQKQEQMQRMLASVPGLADILQGADADSLETRIVDLQRGAFADGIDPATFDAKAAADPAQSVALAPGDDTAGIGRRPNLAPVHLVRRGNTLVLLVLPVYGTGYQSTIRAYLALEGDLNTIAALSVYDQSETPGLGTRITDPAWQRLWTDKKVADGTGTIRIGVVRGGSGEHEVDGITGATRSATGVANLVRFWLGQHGFGPFIANLRKAKP
jgi:Na+-transporting NADH:ubiquinone oxidoreductase subunit C